MGGAGTDTALETADVALMGDDLRKLPFTVKLSRKALNIIKANITLQLLLNLLPYYWLFQVEVNTLIAILSDDMQLFL